MNVIFNDLGKVGYNILKLPTSTETSLAAESWRVQAVNATTGGTRRSSTSAASSKIVAYDRQVCHLSVGAATGTTTARSRNTTVGGSNDCVTVGAKLPAGFRKAVSLPATSKLVAAISSSSKFYELDFLVTGS